MKTVGTADDVVDVEPVRPRRVSPVWLVVGMVVLVAAAAFLIQRSGAEVEDVSGQGGLGTWAERASTLTRSGDRVEVTFVVPRPEPGTYEYPTAEQVLPGVVHPPVLEGEVEVFTAWIIVFNEPDQCRQPRVCTTVDVVGDELTPEPPALGGIFYGDGVVVDGDTVELSGFVDLDTVPMRGVPLTDPACAEVHVAMAPHGRAFEGDELTVQLTQPIGDPNFWWFAEFKDRPPGC